MTFTSDEKRSEVAENLRNLTIGRSIQYKEQFFDELAEVVVGFEDYHDFNVVLEKLADLIDRPTCCNVYDEIYDEYEGGRCENGFKCSKCGEIVEDCEGYRVTGTFNYCPKCGREVVSE